jgi:hypothetical protein
MDVIIVDFFFVSGHHYRVLVASPIGRFHWPLFLLPLPPRILLLVVWMVISSRCQQITS